MTNNIKFVKNNLGNIEVVNRDGTSIEGFIKHIELFYDGADIIHLNISEDEFSKANNIYFHVRHHKRTNILITINQLKLIFKDKNVYYEIEKHNSKLTITNLFLYE